MTRVLKTLLLCIVMLALPLRGMAAIDTSCVRVSQTAGMVAADTFVDSHVGHSAEAHQNDSGNDGTHAKNASSADCTGTDAAHKASTCSGSICHIGAAAPPLNLNLAPVLERTEVAHNPPPVLFAGTVLASLERPPQQLHG